MSLALAGETAQLKPAPQTQAERSAGGSSFVHFCYFGPLESFQIGVNSKIAKLYCDFNMVCPYFAKLLRNVTDLHQRGKLSSTTMYLLAPS